LSFKLSLTMTRFSWEQAGQNPTINPSPMGVVGPPINSGAG
jgi:hypothetical protein